MTGQYGTTQTCFLIYLFSDLLYLLYLYIYKNDFPACWHIIAIHAGPYVGHPFVGAPVRPNMLKMLKYASAYSY